MILKILAKGTTDTTYSSPWKSWDDHEADEDTFDLADFRTQPKSQKEFNFNC